MSRGFTEKYDAKKQNKSPLKTRVRCFVFISTLLFSKYCAPYHRKKVCIFVSIYEKTLYLRSIFLSHETGWLGTGGEIKNRDNRQAKIRLHRKCTANAYAAHLLASTPSYFTNFVGREAALASSIRIV